MLRVRDVELTPKRSSGWASRVTCCRHDGSVQALRREAPGWRVVDGVPERTEGLPGASHVRVGAAVRWPHLWKWVLGTSSFPPFLTELVHLPGCCGLSAP